MASGSVSAVTDRCRGTLLGLAAGDRNGGPIRMALCLGQSLLACQTFDADDLLQRYLRWWREDGIDSGPTTARVLELIDSGMPPDQAVNQAHRESEGLTAGCNPAHRCVPLAMASFIPDEELAGVALREAGLTHRHPLAGDVAAAVAVLSRALVRGEAWTDALERAAVDRLDRTRQALSAGTRGPGGRDGYAPEVLQTAVHFAASGASFDEALRAALDFAGPANYCPVLVGAIAGARWGSTAIASEAPGHPRLTGIEEEVMATATCLARTWGQEARGDA
jgi:ADP-ribosyl-[dinitrogen reductase] hydrolase